MTHRVIMAENIVAYEQLHIESSSNTYIIKVTGTQNMKKKLMNNISNDLDAAIFQESTHHQKLAQVVIWETQEAYSGISMD